MIELRANIIYRYTIGDRRWRRRLRPVLLLLEEDGGVLYERAEDEEDAGQHPYLYGGEALRLGRVGGDVVEDVDEDEEEGDEERHAAGHDVGRDEEGDPGDDHEEAGGEVVRDDVGHHVAAEVLIFFKKNIDNYSFQRVLNNSSSTHHLEPCQRVVP